MTTWRRKIEEYEADLYSLQEPGLLGRLLGEFLRTKRGEIELKRYDDGEKELEVELHGLRIPDGDIVSVVIDGTTVSQFSVSGGHARLRLATAQGDVFPDVRSGSVAEIRHTGELLLRGTFEPD